jgi:hypothetical protein
MATISNGESGSSVRTKLNEIINKVEGVTSINNNIDVTGTITSDGLTVDGVARIQGAATGLVINENDTVDLNTYLNGNNGDFRVLTVNDAFTLFKERINVDHATGDVSFYEDTGTTPKMVWKSADERLGIKTSSPQTTLDLGNGSDGNGIAWGGATGTARYNSITSTYSGAALLLSSLFHGSTSSDAYVTSFTGTHRASGIRLNWTNNNGIQFFTDAAAARTAGEAFVPTERMRITSSGNVGIGTSSPQSELHIAATSPVIRLTDSDTVAASMSGRIDFYGSDARAGYVGMAATTGLALATETTDPVKVLVNSDEKMRIDSSGNLLVGRTDVGLDTESIVLRERGEAYFTSDGRAPMLINRLTSDGDIVSFRKNGTVVGSIGVYAGSRPYFSRSVSGGGFGFGGSAELIPTNESGANNDNSLNLGASTVRWNDVYATNGTIQTSDANEKQDIDVLSDAEQRVAVACKGLLRKFRWKSAVAEKGDDARIHFGIIAQDLQAAFEAEGLDAGRYAMFIHSTWTDEETGEEKSRMGVRYSELLAFIIAAI